VIKITFYLFLYIAEFFLTESLHQSLTIFVQCIYQSNFSSKSHFRGVRIFVAEE